MHVHHKALFFLWHDGHVHVHLDHVSVIHVYLVLVHVQDVHALDYVHFMFTFTSFLSFLPTAGKIEKFGKLATY